MANFKALRLKYVHCLSGVVGDIRQGKVSRVRKSRNRRSTHKSGDFFATKPMCINKKSKLPLINFAILTYTCKSNAHIIKLLIPNDF